MTETGALTGRTPTSPEDLRHRVQKIVQRVMAFKPVRVLTRFGDRRGPLLAAGLSFRAIFAVFAALWVGFSIAGLVIANNRDLSDALVTLISRAVPGLIDTGSGGAISVTDLVSTSVLGWIGAIALVGAVFTAVGWLGAARDAVREIAQLPKLPTNFLLLKLRDLGLALVLGLAFLVSAGLSLLGTTAVSAVLALFGTSENSLLATLATRGVTLLLLFVVDAGVLIGLYRVLAGVPIPRRALLEGGLLGAAALGVLQVLGNTVLGGTSSNPLLAGFTVIVGLLLWFNLVCTVIVLGAAWVVVSAEDAGVPLDPVGDRERREQEAKLRAQLEAEIREELENDLPPAVRWLARRTRRKRERA